MGTGAVAITGATGLIGAALAEREGHHPDFCVHYGRVEVTLWTHAARGLSENDFILASKLDAIVS